MITQLLPCEIKQMIHYVRGQEVMLDSDLAHLYQVETKALNQAVKRNSERFPNENFMFELRSEEYTSLKNSPNLRDLEKRKYRRYLLLVFTSYGVAMLSSVLNSKVAIELNIAIIEAFVEYRKISESLSSLNKKMNHMDEKIHKMELLQSQQLDAFKTFADKILVNQNHSNLYMERRCHKKLPLSLTNEANPEIIEKIQKAVAHYFGLSVKEMNQLKRTAAVVLPRQIAIFLIRKHMKLSYSEIGRLFGKQDHTTVVYAYRKIQIALSKGGSIQKFVLEIEKSLKIEASLN